MTEFYEPTLTVYYSRNEGLVEWDGIWMVPLPAEEREELELWADEDAVDPDEIGKLIEL